MNRATRILHVTLIAILFAALTPGARGALISPATPIPGTEVLNRGNLEWVYAGPGSTNEFGAGQIQAPSFRAGEGWRYATAAEWAVKPLWTDFIKPGYTTVDVPAVSSWSDHAKYRFTSEYWSTF